MCAWKESQVTKTAFIRSKALDFPVSRTMESPKSEEQSDEASEMDWWGWAGEGYTGGMRGTRAKGWNPAEEGESVMMGNGGRLWGRRCTSPRHSWEAFSAGRWRFLVSFYTGRTERREC